MVFIPVSSKVINMIVNNSGLDAKDLYFSNSSSLTAEGKKTPHKCHNYGTCGVFHVYSNSIVAGGFGDMS